MSTSRRQARILAMQALCQWDAQHEESVEGLREFLVSREGPVDAVAAAEAIVSAFWSDRQTVDDRIASAATEWRLSRISPVERNVMRVAIVEMLDESTPPKAALNEAIEIGRAYGGADSPRFINGVLDVVLKQLSPAKKEST
ncbi:MAG: transcription antitermination factor NusB [Phycisphaerae bacterium]|jgi:N utilization substance protein B